MPKPTLSEPHPAGFLALEYSTGGRKNATLIAGAGPGDVAVTPVPRSSGGGVAEALRGAFLPEGWPASVSSDYLSYQLWDSIQGLSSYVRGMLSSHAMLAGVGVGSAAATPLSAAFQFFVKDFAGMLGGVVFASTQGARLDCYAKQWRLAADVLNDVGMALELASPLLPGAFLLLACLGSLARAVTGVAGGATRMALTQHFALQRNAADIAAKEGSQETAVTLVGMMLGMLLIRAAAGLQPLIWAAFWLLTALHVWANVRAMRCLRITSINQARLGLLLRKYLQQGEALTPEQMAEQESLVPPPLQRLLRALGLGFNQVPLVAVAPQLTSLRPVFQRQLASRIQGVAAAEEERRKGSATSSSSNSSDSAASRQYLAMAAPAGDGGAGQDAVVLLRRGARTADVLEGYCVALMLAWGAQLAAAQGGGRGRSHLWPAHAKLALIDVDGWLATSGAAKHRGSGRDSGHAKASGSQDSGSGYQDFVSSLESAGWALDRVALLQGPCRLAWGADLRMD